jgi:hypothetical protein
MQRIIFSSATATTEIQEATFISFLFLYRNKITGVEIDSENEYQSSSMKLFLTISWTMKIQNKFVIFPMMSFALWFVQSPKKFNVHLCQKVPFVLTYFQASAAPRPENSILVTYFNTSSAIKVLKEFKCPIPTTYIFLCS